MKKFIMSIVILSFLFGCGASSSTSTTPSHVYSGKIWIDCMSISNDAQCKKSAAVPLASALASDITDTTLLVTTITTTFNLGNISRAVMTTGGQINGIVINDTPNAITGLWYAWDGGFNCGFKTIPPGGNFAMGGGGYIDSGTPLGDYKITAYFFNITNDPNAPTQNNAAIENVTAYSLTHSPAAVGVALYSVVD